MKITVKKEENLIGRHKPARGKKDSLDKKEKISRHDGAHPSSQPVGGRGRQISVSWRLARATW